ncbi:MAG: hypothetical protein FWE05_03835 [Defluviitaleaceae bacterium]|nr:hypothetical protein [Defluviitaleaceae bacterium]
MGISNRMKIAAVYGSVFLGAGFASGRELMQYFVGFGRIGIWGLMVAGVLFALTGWAVLSICRREKIVSYSGLMRYLLGEKLGTMTEWAVVGFLFCLFVAMLAGAGATAQQAFHLPFTAGAVMVGIVVFAILCFGLNGIIKVNLILAPFMVFGGIFIGLFTFFTYATPAFAGIGTNLGLAWLLSAVVYASYNLVTGIPVLAATSGLAVTKSDARFGGIVGGGIITVLGISMALPLFLYYADIITLEIPFLYIADGYGHGFSALYLTVLITALLTTAACNGFAVLQWAEGLGFKNKAKAAAMICAFGVIASHIGFSNIVAYIYPLFGFLGLFKIVVILFSAVKKRG